MKSFIMIVLLLNNLIIDSLGIRSQDVWHGKTYT